jgi:hypothetical protein
MADVQAAFAKGLEEGKMAASMLDPGPIESPNPDYILSPQNYIRTRREKWTERVQRRELDAVKDAENADSDARQSMTPSEYLEWKNSQ